VPYSSHLVDDGFCTHKNSITLIYQDQRGSLFFLAVDHGKIVQKTGEEFKGV
jgi:hypothetical protein